MRVFHGLLICLAGIAPGADAATAAALPGRLPAGVVPVHYDLRIEPDAGALTFSGHATIDVEVAKPTATITLNALDLDIESARLDRASAAVVTLDPQAQTATLRFENPVEPGRQGAPGRCDWLAPNRAECSLE